MLDEVDLLMEYNNDLYRREAEKIIEKNKESMEDTHLKNMETYGFGKSEDNEEEEDVRPEDKE